MLECWKHNFSSNLTILASWHLNRREIFDFKNKNETSSKFDIWLFRSCLLTTPPTWTTFLYFPSYWLTFELKRIFLRKTVTNLEMFDIWFFRWSLLTTPPTSTTSPKLISKSVSFSSHYDWHCHHHSSSSSSQPFKSPPTPICHMTFLQTFLLLQNRFFNFQFFCSSCSISNSALARTFTSNGIFTHTFT